MCHTFVELSWNLHCRFDFVWFSLKIHLESSFLTLEPAVCSWKLKDECGQTLFSLRSHSYLCNNPSVGFILQFPAVFRRVESFHRRSRGVIWWMLHHRMNQWWGWSSEGHVPCSDVSLCDIFSFRVTHSELLCFWINKLTISEGSQPRRAPRVDGMKHFSDPGNILCREWRERSPRRDFVSVKDTQPDGWNNTIPPVRLQDVTLGTFFKGAACDKWCVWQEILTQLHFAESSNDQTSSQFK